MTRDELVRMAYLRLGLDLGQMLAAAAALVLLLETGFSAPTVGAASIATALTAVSLAIFRGRRSRSLPRDRGPR